MVVDSNGALGGRDVRRLVRQYGRAAGPAGKEVGIHAHNNPQLAFANTLAAMEEGATRLDATTNGMGRGAGNCPMELLIGYLRGPSRHLPPILEFIENHMLEMRRILEWGPLVPCNITGLLDLHPRLAMARRAGESRDAYAAFLDQCGGQVRLGD